MPRRNDIAEDSDDRLRADRDRPVGEFDYSGTQACKALKAEGYEVVLVNSNPATIMTDPELADRTYIEPLTAAYLEEIIRVEAEMLTAGSGKFALLPTVGGQTALNLAVDLADAGVLESYGVELIGAKLEAIKKAEDRLLFKDAMTQDRPRHAAVAAGQQPSRRPGLRRARSASRCSSGPASRWAASGGGIAYNREELMEILARGLDLSPVHECLIEESVLGWKEYELEVMRDLADNVIIICSIENFDPMGVHTGDSITVAPAQTLTDREYQMMRDAAIAVHARDRRRDRRHRTCSSPSIPPNGRMTVIEMNPRVSRSSALASKATGFPIAKIAAKLAVGYTLDEIPNDITARHAGLLRADHRLRRRQDSQVAVREIPRRRRHARPADEVRRRSDGHRPHLQGSADEGHAHRSRPARRPRRDDIEPRRLTQRLVTPHPDRLGYIRFAFERGMSVREVARLTSMDPWFLHQIEADHATRSRRSARHRTDADHRRAACAQLKRIGISRRAHRRRVGAGRARRHASRCANCARSSASGRSSSWSIPAPPSSRAITPYLYSTATTKRTRRRRPTSARRS